MKCQNRVAVLLFALCLLLVMGLAMASPVNAAPKKSCCIPAQMEFDMGMATGVGTEHGNTETNRLGKMSMDFPNRRMAYQDHHDDLKLLMFPKQNIEYVIYNGKCIKQPLPVVANMSTQCLPPGAKYQGTFHYGIGKESLTVDSWAMTMKGEGYQYLVNVLVTPDNCMPVTELTVGKQGGSDIMLALSYFDPHIGIKDPHVFDIPDICKKVDVGLVQPIPEVHVRKSFLFYA